MLEEVGKTEDVNIQDDQKRTPLHEAARWGRLPAIRYLCDKGADLNAKSSKDLTPLQEAEANRKLEATEFLEQRKKGP